MWLVTRGRFFVPWGDLEALEGAAMLLAWSWNAIYSCALVVPGGVGGLAPSHVAVDGMRAGQSKRWPHAGGLR